MSRPILLQMQQRQHDIVVYLMSGGAEAPPTA
jgi:hypothetical protein